MDDVTTHRADPVGVHHSYGIDGYSNEGRLDLVVLLALATIWIATHPYLGIVHDARLYSVQALNLILPGRYADDLFLRYGSQESFTAFSQIYKYLVAFLGVGRANLAGTVIGQGLWIVSALLLLRTIFPKREDWIAASLGVTILYPGYGGLRVFQYAEPFTTPRIFAEAAVLAALAAALRRKTVLPAFLILVAMTVHPIMAATGGAMLAVAAAFRDKRWLLFFLGSAILVFAAALIDLGPFGRLLLHFDGAWFDVVRQRCGFGVLQSWRLEDWVKLASDCGLLIVGWMLGTARERLIIKIVAVSCVAALSAAFLGGDLLRDILIVNLQPWRELWLLSLSANALMMVLALRIPNSRTSRELFLASVSINFVEAFFKMPISVFSSLTLLACAIFTWEHFRGKVVPRWARYGLLTLAALTIWISVFAIYVYRHEARFPYIVSSADIGIAALILLYLAIKRLRFWWLLPIAPLLTIAALVTADQRSGWQNLVESPSKPAGLETFLADSKNIYWEGPPGMELIWLNLKKPSYNSCLQGAGAMFYRQTAMQYLKRTTALQSLNSFDFNDSLGGMCPGPSPTNIATSAELRSACERLPELDTIILASKISGVTSMSWQAPVASEVLQHDGRTNRIDRYYRYDCAKWR